MKALAQHTSAMVENGKAQALASTFTTAAGLGTVLDYLPDALGVFATMSGITLTWVMICKVRLDIKKVKASIEDKDNAI